MSCSLTTGYALGCRNSVGGIKTSLCPKPSNATVGPSAANASGQVTGFIADLRIGVLV